MKLVDGPVVTAVRSWISRVDRRHPSRVDCFSELRSWVNCVILEAEKNRDFNRRALFESSERALRLSQNGV
jgi:hypothetical protein